MWFFGATSTARGQPITDEFELTSSDDGAGSDADGASVSTEVDQIALAAVAGGRWPISPDFAAGHRPPAPSNSDSSLDEALAANEAALQRDRPTPVPAPTSRGSGPDPKPDGVGDIDLAASISEGESYTTESQSYTSSDSESYTNTSDGSVSGTYETEPTPGQGRDPGPGMGKQLAGAGSEGDGPAESNIVKCTINKACDPKSPDEALRICFKCDGTLCQACDAAVHVKKLKSHKRDRISVRLRAHLIPEFECNRPVSQK